MILSFLRAVVLPFWLLFTFALAPAASQTRTILTPSGEEEGFGLAVDIDGNRMLIGTAEGMVYAYTWENEAWQEIGVLTTSDSTRSDKFGHDISISGDYAAIGAPDHKEREGAVYLYKWDGTMWQEMSRLEKGDWPNRFGNAVDLHTNQLIVGAPELDRPGWPDTAMANAYIYEFVDDVWLHSATLTKPDVLLSTFGDDVAIQDDIAVVVGEDNYHMFHYGSAFVYRKDGEQWVPMITIDTGSSDSRHPIVAMNQHRLIYGNIAYPGDLSPGYVVLYERSSTDWQLVRRFQQGQPEDQDAFGQGIAIDENILAVSATSERQGNSFGFVYIYDWDGASWILIDRISAGYTSADWYFGFGHTIATSGDHIAIGAPRDTFARTNGAGSVHMITYSSTSVASDPFTELPAQPTLQPNFPNPFSTRTSIPLLLHRSEYVVLEVFDVTGKRVEVITEGTLPAGQHTFAFDADHHPNGVYVYRLQTGASIISQTMTILR